MPPTPSSATQNEDEAEENVVSLWTDDKGRHRDFPETSALAVAQVDTDGEKGATILAAATASAEAEAGAGAGEGVAKSEGRTGETSSRGFSSMRWAEGEAGGHRGSSRLGEQGLHSGDVRDENDNDNDSDENCGDDDDEDEDRDDVDGDNSGEHDDGNNNRRSGCVADGTLPSESCDGSDDSIDGDVRRSGSRSHTGAGSVGGGGGNERGRGGGGGGGDGGGGGSGDGSGAGETTMQSKAAAETLAPIDDGGGSGNASCSSGRGALVRANEKDAGFFGGTAQLALRPGAMLSRALHPALAPPDLPLFGDGAAVDAAAVASMPASTRLAAIGARPGCRYGVSRGWGGVAELGCGSDGGSGEGVRKGGAGEGGGVGDDEGLAAAAAGPAVATATAMEDVAKALPPAMILETCLLGPLRRHCRLAGSSCLGVFTEDLGIARLTGGFRRGREGVNGVGRRVVGVLVACLGFFWRWRQRKSFSLFVSSAHSCFSCFQNY